MPKQQLSDDFIKAAMNHPGVLAQLQVVADRIKKRAEGLAADAGHKMTVGTRTGVRPGGRPYVDVIADDADQEYGTSAMGRLRILGRAGAEG